ncbi:MAG: IclR family transcriptional regulator [Pseudomonadota bacterium]
MKQGPHCTMTTGSGIQVIARAAEILRQLKQDNSGQSLGAIAVQTGLPRSTVQRIVHALVAEDLVTTSGKDSDLRLGPAIQSLAAAGRIDVVHVMRPLLERLSKKTGETVDLAKFQHAHMVFVDQVIGKERLGAVSLPGEEFPLSNTANGKAILAMLAETEVVDIHRREGNGCELRVFLNDLAATRERGVAFDIDEHTDGISAAGIAFQTVGEDFYAVSIPAPSRRFAEKREMIAQALLSFRADAIATNPYFR